HVPRRRLARRVAQSGCLFVEVAAELAVRAPVLEHHEDLGLDVPCRFGEGGDEVALGSARRGTIREPTWATRPPWRWRRHATCAGWNSSGWTGCPSPNRPSPRAGAGCCCGGPSASGPRSTGDTELG